MFKKAFFNASARKAIIAATAFFSICAAFCADAETVPMKWRSVLNENFRPLSYKNLSEKNKQDLLDRNISPEKVLDTQFPLKWRCDVKKFPTEWEFKDQGEDGLYIKVDPNITIYTSAFDIARDAFRVDIKAVGPGTLMAGVTFTDNPDLTFERKVEKDTNNLMHFTYEAPAGTSGLISIRLVITGELNLLSAKVDALSGDDASVIEGTLTDISFMPQIADMAEDSCYFTAECKVNQTLEGKTLPHTVRLLVPGMFRRNLADGSNLRRNAKCRFTVKPFFNCVEEQQMTRQISSLEEDLLPVFLVTETVQLNRFTTNSNTDGYATDSLVPANFVPRFPDADEDLTSQISAGSAAFISEQTAVIAKEQDKLKEAESSGLLKKFPAAWADMYELLDKLPSGEGWYYDKNAAWALPKDFDFDMKSKVSAPVLASLTSFRDFLNSRGIRFLVQVIPSAKSVAARRIVTQYEDMPDPTVTRVTAQLLAAGFEAMSADAVLAKVDSKDAAPALYVYSVNNALNDPGQNIIARQAAEYLKSQFPQGTFPALFKSDDFVSKKRVFNFKTTAHKWPKDVKFVPGLPDTSITGTEINVNKESFRPNPSSPILVFGNQIVHQPTPFCNYAARLAMNLLHAPDVFAIYGQNSWTTAMMHIYRNPERYLNGKKVVVFPVYASDLCIKHNTPDLHKIEESGKMLQNKVLFSELKVLDFRTHVDSVKLPVANRPVWRSFLYSTVYIGTFSENALTKTMRSIALPEGANTKKNLVCRIRCALHYSVPEVSVNINGTNYTVYASAEGAPQWQELDIPLKEGTEKIDISIIAPNQDAIFAIRDIKLYADAE